MVLQAARNMLCMLHDTATNLMGDLITPGVTNTHFRCLGVPSSRPHPKIGFTRNLSHLLAARYKERLHPLSPACIVSCSNDLLPKKRV